MTKKEIKPLTSKQIQAVLDTVTKLTLEGEQAKAMDYLIHAGFLRGRDLIELNKELIRIELSVKTAIKKTVYRYCEKNDSRHCPVS